MKSVIKLMCILTLFLGSSTELSAQERVNELEKIGFFKRAFNDMKESTRRQHEIDRANFKAHKLEAKARQEAAEKRIKEAKQTR